MSLDVLTRKDTMLALLFHVMTMLEILPKQEE